LVLSYARRRPSGESAGEPPAQARTLVLFVAGWAIVLMAIAIAWWLFHRP
jgi:hypothetical protein